MLRIMSFVEPATSKELILPVTPGRYFWRHPTKLETVSLDQLGEATLHGGYKMGDCTLEDVLRESGKLLGNKGRFYMVHRPFRLAEILSGMSRHRIEPKRMRLVHPYIDKEPNMVLLEGVKGAHPRMTEEPPLVVYNKDGTYTEELLELYGLESRKEAGR